MGEVAAVRRPRLLPNAFRELIARMPTGEEMGGIA
jgi:hypothetical protein